MPEKKDTKMVKLYGDSSMPLEQRIEKVFDVASLLRQDMQIAMLSMVESEEAVKADCLDEWMAAKNNDVRKAIIQRELVQNDEYQSARLDYRRARDDYQRTLLEIQRLKLLVALHGGGR